MGKVFSWVVELTLPAIHPQFMCRKAYVYVYELQSVGNFAKRSLWGFAENETCLGRMEGSLRTCSHSQSHTNRPVASLGQ